MNYLTMGDEIEVNGDRFILTSYTVERNRPPRVQFKSTVELSLELLEEGNG